MGDIETLKRRCVSTGYDGNICSLLNADVNYEKTSLFVDCLLGMIFVNHSMKMENCKYTPSSKHLYRSVVQYSKIDCQVTFYKL